MNVSDDAPVSRHCPACGERGRVLGGTYEFAQNAISLLQGTERTRSELEKLARIFRTARERGAGVEEVKAEVERVVPELSSVSNMLPKNRNELYAFIGMILAALALMLEAMNAGETPQIEIKQVIEQTVVQTDPAQGGRLGQKVGRNEMCPCGSGQKFKRCHGTNGRTRYVGP
ncbi:MAG: SEC-C domain-containing protein [Rubrobacter sp.]|nr:SEC-C domain-containing protein [Rubrobacter sp.]